jgi:putative FmdB family regulatory protein
LNIPEVAMPIYEYRCSSCGFEKEFLQKVSDPVLTRCPECGQEAFVKLMSTVGFQLKGTGWYATDFKGSPAPKPESKPEDKSAGCSGSCACASAPSEK